MLCHRRLHGARSFSQMIVSHRSSGGIGSNKLVLVLSNSSNETKNGSFFHSSSTIGLSDKGGGTTPATAPAPATPEDIAAQEALKAAKAAAMAQKIAWRNAALDYNNRRAAYNRSVKQLRKEYAQQIAEEKERERISAESARQTLTRQRLERQRRKNEKSAANALALEQFRLDREQEFQHHLEQQQIIRNAKYQRFQAARQLVIDEILEPEAPVWLTTPEEVQAAFTHENMQLLWGRPGGVLGAPNPTLDAKFWEYQAHTWHMNKTYKSPKQVLLEELEHEAYEDANIDPAIWTPERKAEWENKKRKAKLRAMIHAAGRTALIKRQQQLLEEKMDQQKKENDLPKPKPVPSLALLRNHAAMEQEGAKIAMEKPHEFFQFDQSMASGRGVPVDLVDPLRKEYPTIFPLVVGRDPPADTRTEKEKKQELRDLEKKWSVTEAVNDMDDDDEDDDNDPDAIDYESFKGIEDDEDFKAGRYSEDEIEWVTEKLSQKLNHYLQEFAQDLDSARQDLKSQATAGDGDGTTSTTTTLEAAILKLSDDELILLSDLDEKYSRMTQAQAEAAMAEIRLSREHILQLVSRDRTVDLEED